MGNCDGPYYNLHQSFCKGLILNATYLQNGWWMTMISEYNLFCRWFQSWANWAYKACSANGIRQNQLFLLKISFKFKMSGDDHSFIFSMYITYLLDDFADSRLQYPPSTSVPPSSNSPNSVFLRILGPVWNLTVYLNF